MLYGKVKDELKFWMGRRLIIFSVLLAALGIWVLLPAVLIGNVPISANKAAQLSQSEFGRFRALAAARLALIRGDLWAAAAEVLNDSARVSGTGAANQMSEDDRQNLSSACRYALRLAPISSHLWTVCAAYCGNGTSDACVSKYIQMSYFTGPYTVASIPDRLRAAMRIDFNQDPDLKMLVDEDVRFILRQEAALRPDLASSYRDALAANKPAILSEIKETDPAFAATLQ